MRSLAPLSAYDDDQRQKNLRTSGEWSRYQAHREKAHAILCQGALPSDSLAVLGAGNGNDLDLLGLTRRFERVTLVDCDLTAMQGAVSRMNSHRPDAADSVPPTPSIDSPPGAPPIPILLQRDLSGCFEQLDAQLQSGNEMDGKDQLGALRSAATPTPDDGPFSRVASMCLLSQLIDRLTFYLSPDDAIFPDLLQALRRLHLRTLLEWTKPGGEALLFLDVVSSDTAPSLSDCPPDRLSVLLAELFQQGNFFRGLHPGQIVEQLRCDPELSRFLDMPPSDGRHPAGSTAPGIKVAAPWIWNVGPRCYAVTCIRIRRST